MQSITSAPQGLSEDQSRRTRRYLIQMGIRVVCFAGAVFIDVTWLRIVLIIGAVVIPYVAVLLANAGRDRSSREVPVVPPPQPHALPATPTSEEPPGEHHPVIEHVPDPEDADPTSGDGGSAGRPDATPDREENR